VHNLDISKLDVHACEEHWLSFDVNTQAHCVFWLGPGNVTVEHTIYFGTLAQFEREETMPVIPMLVMLPGEQSDTLHTPKSQCPRLGWAQGYSNERDCPGLRFHVIPPHHLGTCLHPFPLP